MYLIVQTVELYWMVYLKKKKIKYTRKLEKLSKDMSDEEVKEVLLKEQQSKERLRKFGFL